MTSKQDLYLEQAAVERAQASASSDGLLKAVLELVAREYETLACQSSDGAGAGPARSDAPVIHTS